MNKQRAVPAANESFYGDKCYFSKTEYNGDPIGRIFHNGCADWCLLFDQDVTFERNKECLAAFPNGADVTVTTRRET